jgi:predicted Zn-dependent peptidase
VQDRRLAINVQAGSTYPDGRYTNLFLFLLAPAPSHTAEETQKALEEVLFRLKTQKVGEEALNQSKAHVRAFSYQRLENTATMAQMAALYTAVYGDWKQLFSLIEDIRKVTEDDVMRCAQRYFIPGSRTTAYSSPFSPLAGPMRTGEGQ